MNGDKVLDISWGTILKISIAILSLYIIYLVKDILIWFIVALIISILFNPAINFLERLKIPRVLGVTFIYVVVFGILGLVIYGTTPLFISEIQQFSQLLPQYLGKISPLFQSFGLPVFEDIESFTQALSGDLDKIAASFADAIFAIFGGIISTVFILSMVIFISLEKTPVERGFRLLFPKKYENHFLNFWEKTQLKVSGWFLTRILACLFVGVLSYFAFLLFNTKYPFSLGLLAGVLNFIPVVGPIITGVLIFLIASLDSLLKGAFVLIVFTLIQQVENNILTPILSRKFIGISPILVLITLAVGGKLFGLLGAILAVPLGGIFFEFLKEFLQKKKKEEGTAKLAV